jgi:hypothetical protein
MSLYSEVIRKNPSRRYLEEVLGFGAKNRHALMLGSHLSRVVLDLGRMLNRSSVTGFP